MARPFIRLTSLFAGIRGEEVTKAGTSRTLDMTWELRTSCGDPIRGLQRPKLAYLSAPAPLPTPNPTQPPSLVRGCPTWLNRNNEPLNNLPKLCFFISLT